MQHFEIDARPKGLNGLLVNSLARNLFYTGGSMSPLRFWRLDVSFEVLLFCYEEATTSLLRHFHPLSCYHLLFLLSRDADSAGRDADSAGPELFDASD